MVIPILSSAPSDATHIPIVGQDAALAGLDYDSVAMADLLTTVRKSKLGDKVGSVSAAMLGKIVFGVRLALTDPRAALELAEGSPNP